MIKSFPFWCGVASAVEILLLYYLSVEKFETLAREHIFRCQRNYVTEYMMAVI